MRRRVTLHIPAIALVTGFVDVPDTEPTDDELTEEQLDDQAKQAAAGAGIAAADQLRSEFAMTPIMTGRWPERLGGSSIEIVLEGEVAQVDVHPIV